MANESPIDPLVQEFFANPDEHAILNALSIHVENYYGYEAVTEDETSVMPEALRTVAIIWSVTGFIENSGVESFWALPVNRQLLFAAYERVGLEKLAEILRESLKLLPSDSALLDALDLEKYFGSGKKCREAASPFSKKFFANSKGMNEPLAKYARTHCKDFTNLLCGRLPPKKHNPPTMPGGTLVGDWQPTADLSPTTIEKRKIFDKDGKQVGFQVRAKE